MLKIIYICTAKAGASKHSNDSNDYDVIARRCVSQHEQRPGTAAVTGTSWGQL